MAQTKKKRIAAFEALSRVLTGVEHLNPDLTQPYLSRLDKAFGVKRLNDLLNLYDEKVADADDAVKAVDTHIMKNDQFGAVAREVIVLWYTAGFRAPEDQSGKPVTEVGPEAPEQYFQGLLWPTIRAHPLGLSGGYFGYWKYPPEN